MSLDTAIFGAERVRDARFRFAEAFRSQSGGVETLRGEIGDDGRCAPLRQSKVILLGAGCVGMAVDFKILTPQARIFERLGELIEIVLGGLRQLVRIEFEIDEKIEDRKSTRLTPVT